MSKLSMALIVVLSVVPITQAVDFGGTEVGITADVTFMSKNIWRGYNLMDSAAVWKPSLDFDLGGGFGANILGEYAGSSGHVNSTRYQYTLYYGGSMLDDSYKTDYVVGWRYYDYIDMPTKGVDAQELFVELAMPQLVGAGFVPRLGTYYMWQSRSGLANSVVADGGNKFGSGWIYVAGFDYNFTIPDMAEYPMTFMWDITYNDGLGVAQDNEWTHMTWGLKSEIACPFVSGAKLVPQVYFQNTFDGSLNERYPGSDILYGGVSYSLKF